MPASILIYIMHTLAAIFDMDGVIAHTNPYHNQAFQVFFDRHGVPYTLAEFEDHMYGKHNSYIMSYFFKRPIAGDELLALEDEKEGLFREIYAAHIQALPGFLNFLSDLETAGFKLGVATSAPSANLDLIIDGLGIRPFMASILASEDVSAHKPDPQVYLKSMANLGASAMNSLVFEDSLSGVRAGLGAGAKVIGVLSSHGADELPGCTHYVTDFTGLDAAFARRIISGGTVA